MNILIIFADLNSVNQSSFSWDKDKRCLDKLDRTSAISKKN